MADADSNNDSRILKNAREALRRADECHKSAIQRLEAMQRVVAVACSRLEEAKQAYADAVAKRKPSIKSVAIEIAQTSAEYREMLSTVPKRKPKCRKQHIKPVPEFSQPVLPRSGSIVSMLLGC